MTHILQRSLLLTLGAAALTRDMAEAVASELVKKGQDSTSEGRKALDEMLDRAKGEARSFKGGLDDNIQKTLKDLGIAMHSQLDELELKVAQLEHRLSLLEASRDESGPAAEKADRQEGTGQTSED